MRVITGTARGAKLIAPKGMQTRPTADRVKEGLFTAIQFELEGRRVLDLFAGSGQLGIEALSRGAKSCTFVDESSAAVRLVRENLAACRLDGEVVQTESVGFLSGCGPYDLIFLDPPYDSTLLDKALSAVIQYDKLAVGGIIVCESRREKRLPEVSAPYRMKRQRAYGKIMLTLYEREAD